MRTKIGDAAREEYAAEEIGSFQSYLRAASALDTFIECAEAPRIDFRAGRARRAKRRLSVRH